MTEKLNDMDCLSLNWQQQLATAFTTLDALCDYLNISPATLPISINAAQAFALRVPLSFAACIEKGNPNDPLLRQVLPVSDELLAIPGYSNDPVGDLPALRQIGLIHKYQGRVLLVNTGSCAINCRYCFRRNFPYTEWQLGKQQERAVIATIADDPSIQEVILSGGDPLLLNDSRFSELLTRLSEVDSLQRIRIHTRIPIVLPARITDALLETLAASTKRVVVVVHCNHANEISAPVAAACQRLQTAGALLLNQSVLLKGVNDNADTLAQLSERLFAIGVLPYYLHLLDKANGTAHFEVAEDEALRILLRLQARLPGYLVPRMVKEVAGAAAKQLVF